MKSRFIPLCLSVSFGAVCSLQAASISWSSLLAEDNPIDGLIDEGEGAISTAGNLVVAENLGGNAITWDGVDFAAGTTSFGSTYAAFYNNNAANQLFDTGTYSGSAANLNLSGLVIDQTYLVELVLVDARAAQEGRTVVVDGEDPIQFAYNGNDTFWPARVIRGTFTADATTQQISIQTFNVGGSSAGSQLNAYQLRAIPEPSSCAMIGLAGLGFILRRRR
ncbi:hypothetical protein Rhal01_03631 [Rubritalea halochordaticola]|uniref:Ice-binding protein C-terminal domain-containing protein n=1 Tax=Rubritalea halochordaticola TaxID=714537 RepID=A0ABP9V620_9BACT